MACPPNVAQALSVAQKSGCAPLGPSRMMLLMDRVASSRCQLGQTVFAQLTGIPERDAAGRIAHVRGFFIAAQANVTRGATNDPVSTYQLLGLIKNLFLEDGSGHVFWNNIDARDVSDDVYFRAGGLVGWLPLHYGAQGASVPAITNTGVAQNAGAGTSSYNLSIYLPTVNPRGMGNPFEGLIPLRALQAAVNGGLRFTIGNAIPGAGGALGVGAPAGITLNKIVNVDGTDGLQIWADVVYLPDIALDAPWTLESYPLTDQNVTLWHPDRLTVHAAIRFHTEDSNQNSVPTYGQKLCNYFTQLAAFAGGMQLFSAMSIADMTARTMSFLSTDDQSAIVHNNSTRELPILDPSVALTATPLYAVPIVQYRGRMTSPSGGINVQITGRDGAWTRFLHRTVACHSQGRLDKVARDVGRVVGSLTPIDAKGRATSQQAPRAAYMPVLMR